MKKKQGNQKRGCGGKKNSVQELLSIQYFTKYGLMTEHGEMVFFQIAPTNISVLSYENIERKINHLQGLISMHPDMEIVCTDSCECFDGNREYLRRRALEESNRQVRSILEKDREMLSQMQSEMSNARQFYLVIPTHQFLFNPGQINPKDYMDALQVEPSEYDLIHGCERGHNLYRCGNERYLLQVIAPEHKAALFGTAGGR